MLLSGAGCSGGSCPLRAHLNSAVLNCTCRPGRQDTPAGSQVISDQHEQTNLSKHTTQLRRLEVALQQCRRSQKDTSAKSTRPPRRAPSRPDVMQRAFWYHQKIAETLITWNGGSIERTSSGLNFMKLVTAVYLRSSRSIKVDDLCVRRCRQCVSPCTNKAKQLADRWVQC